MQPPHGCIFQQHMQPLWLRFQQQQPSRGLRFQQVQPACNPYKGMSCPTLRQFRGIPARMCSILPARAPLCHHVQHLVITGALLAQQTVKVLGAFLPSMYTHYQAFGPKFIRMATGAFVPTHTGASLPIQDLLATVPAFTGAHRSQRHPVCQQHPQ